MLQQFEYDPFKLLRWIAGFPDLGKTVNRGKLVFTSKTIALLIIGYILFMGTQLFGIYSIFTGRYILGVVLVIFSFDFAWISIFLLSFLGKLILEVKRAPLMNNAKTKFSQTNSLKIAVMGSYGKTSMKEMLSTVLSGKFDVAVTPGNKNVPISHARWVTNQVSGKEDILVIEYGEGEPGDISELASLSTPNIVIMTGTAPNHLDHYKTFDNLINDFLDIQKYVPLDKLYVNSSADDFVNRLDGKAKLYSEREVDGWKISDIELMVNGTNFLMKKGNNTLKISSGIIGRHNVSPLALVAVIAWNLGMTKQEIEISMKGTKPFEHRMQPRLVSGAWIIDDTYNGNLEGFKAGLLLLKELAAKRKIYVTPGLVDQGEETSRVHKEIAKAIFESNPDKVVLMDNKNTEIIKDTLNDLGYKGSISIETNPLDFYNNIDQFIASGDLVLMQNDLPDAYR